MNPMTLPSAIYILAYLGRPIPPNAMIRHHQISLLINFDTLLWRETSV